MWIENGLSYDLTGAFIAGLATFYCDSRWQLYDPATGAIRVTSTQAAFEAAAVPNVPAAYNNYCVQGKRIVGLPGDLISMRDGTLWRNGSPVAEPYVTLKTNPPALDPASIARIRSWQVHFLGDADTAGYQPTLRTWGPLRIPADSLMALGDNRDESFDSRYYGFIPRANLRGSPLFIYYSYDATSWRPLPFLAAIRWGRATAARTCISS